MSIAHAAFYGIGAYTTAILAVNYGFSFLLTLPLAIIICGLTALIVAIVSIRTVDDYFIVITLGIQVVVFSIMNNWQEFTRGPLGIPNIPPINIFGLSIDNHLSFFALSLFFMGLIWFLLNNITRSPFGKILIALSEDEIFTKSLGKNVNKSKVISFIISAMFAAVAGVLYAHYISYIDPSSFTIDESIFILSIVIIGDMRDLKRITIVAAFLILLPEVLRFVGMPNSVAANVRQIVYGTCLILFMFKNTDKLHT